MRASRIKGRFGTSTQLLARWADFGEIVLVGTKVFHGSRHEILGYDITLPTLETFQARGRACLSYDAKIPSRHGQQ
jgi:hypothetical protein